MKTAMRDSNVVIPGVRKSGHRQWFMHQAAARGFIVSDSIADHKPIKARIDHGRWLVDCPLINENQQCLGAELVTEDDKVFLCLSCGNKEVDGKLIPVRFPTKKKRVEIEDLLDRRPESNRNWFPGETAKKITKENKRHGMEVLEDAE